MHSKNAGAILAQHTPDSWSTYATFLTEMKQGLSSGYNYNNKYIIAVKRVKLCVDMPENNYDLRYKNKCT
jgi:hypothetical protein